MLICGTDISVTYDPDPDQPGWTLMPAGDLAAGWVARADLHGRRFDRRADLLAAVSAHHAADPLPIAITLAPDPPLRRISATLYRSHCNTYEIRRSDPADRTLRSDRWKITHIAQLPRPAGAAGTLAQARVVIRADRFRPDWQT